MVSSFVEFDARMARTVDPDDFLGGAVPLGRGDSRGQSSEKSLRVGANDDACSNGWAV